MGRVIVGRVIVGRVNGYPLDDADVLVYLFSSIQGTDLFVYVQIIIHNPVLSGSSLDTFQQVDVFF